MASIRSLKSDINFLASELVSQAYMGRLLFKTLDDEGFSNFVNKAIEFRAGFIASVNRPVGKENPKMVKGYFSKIRKEMLTRFDELAGSIIHPKEAE